MRIIKKIEEPYMFEGVFDVFVENVSGEIIYYFDTLKSIRIVHTDRQFDIYFEDGTFKNSILNLFNKKDLTLYFRSHKRSYKMGVDEPFCFKIDNCMLLDFRLESQAESKTALAPIKFLGTNLHLISDEECPQFSKNKN